jgi:hypothetical protein
MVLFMKGYLPTSVLCFLVLIFRLFLAVLEINKYSARTGKSEFLCMLGGTSASCWAVPSSNLSPVPALALHDFSQAILQVYEERLEWRHGRLFPTSLSIYSSFYLSTFYRSLFNMTTISLHFLSAHLSYGCIPLSRPPTRSEELTNVSCQLK